MQEYYIELVEPITDPKKLEAVMDALAIAFNQDVSSLRTKVQAGQGRLLKAKSAADARKYQEIFQGIGLLTNTNPPLERMNDDRSQAEDVPPRERSTQVRSTAVRPAATKKQSRSNTLAVVGALLFLLAGIVVTFVSTDDVIIYASLFAVALILALIAVAQRRSVSSMLTLVAAIVLPPLFYFGIPALNLTNILSGSQIQQGLDRLNPADDNENPTADDPTAVNQVTDDPTPVSVDTSVDTPPPATPAPPASEEEQEAYRSNLEVFDFEARFVDAVPAVRLSIRNNGNRTLQSVNFTAYFRDNSDTIIYRETFAAWSALAAGGFTELAPNTTFSLPEGSYIRFEDAPAGWQEGNVILEFESIAFKD